MQIARPKADGLEAHSPANNGTHAEDVYASILLGVGLICPHLSAIITWPKYEYEFVLPCNCILLRRVGLGLTQCFVVMHVRADCPES